jgi:hypothetical protein
MIHVVDKGSFDKTFAFLTRMKKGEHFKGLEKYGAKGVEALSAATPVDSHETASSWTYEIVQKRGSYSIHWLNTHEESGIPIAAIIQYGHATGNGAYIEGIDYINPAIRPIFDQIINDMWKEVTR